MKNVTIILYLFLVTASIAFGQLWEPLGGGTSYIVRDIYTDTIDNVLYLSGDFEYAGDTLCRGVATWDGNVYHPLGEGIRDLRSGNETGAVFSIQRFDNSIYVAGSFQTSFQHKNSKRISKWNGTHWMPFGNPNGSTYLTIANDELFASGYYDTIGGVAQTQISRWNGHNWVPFADFSEIDYNDSRFVKSAEYYKGEYYFAGNFESPFGFGEIARWDGIEWKTLETGIHGGLSSVWDMQVFNGLLFVAGSFDYGSGNIADCIMAWDGEHWSNAFPDLYCRYIVKKMEVIEGELYLAGGNFFFDTGSSIKGPYAIAKYDGNQLCAFGGDSIIVNDIAGVNGEIYVTGGYQLSYFKDTIKYIGRWIGGDSVDVCISQPLNAADQVTQTPPISLYPNPAQSHFGLNLPANAGSCSFSIYDVAGRQVLPQQNYTGEEIEISGLASGVYFVSIQLRGQQQVLKLLKP